MYAVSALKSPGLRSALPYYEISVEVRGPTLSSVRISGGSYWDLIQKNQFGFLPGRFDYRVGLFSEMLTVTLAATAAHTDATVTITPDDADANTDGHQVNSIPGDVRVVSITVTRGSDTEVYTINFSQP